MGQAGGNAAGPSCKPHSLAIVTELSTTALLGPARVQALPPRIRATTAGQ